MSWFVRTAYFGLILAIATYLCTCGERSQKATSLSTQSVENVLVESRTSPNVGESTELRLLAASSHEFSFELGSGEALDVRVDQIDVDLLVEVLAPGRDLPQAVDSPLGARGPERVCLVAVEQGTHRLNISSWVPTQAGRYEITIDRMGPATETDHYCMQASQSFADARKRSEQGADPFDVAETFAEASRLWHQSGHRIEEAIALGSEAEVWVNAGDGARGRQLYQDAISLLSGLGSGAVESVYHNYLGLSLRESGELAAAQSQFETALKLASIGGDQQFEAAARNNLGLIYRVRGDRRRALAEYEKALELWLEVGDLQRAAQARFNIGVSYTVLGSFGTALGYLETALAWYESSDDKSSHAKVLSALAWIKLQQGALGEAVRFGEQALARSRLAEDLLRTAEALDRLGTIYRALERNDDAAAAYREARSLFDTLGRKRDHAHTTTNLAWLLGAEGQHEEVSEQLEAAILQLRRSGDIEGLASALGARAQLKRSAADLSASRTDLEEVVGLVYQVRRQARSHGYLERQHLLDHRYLELFLDVLLDLDDLNPGAGHDERAFQMSDFARAQNLYVSLLSAGVNLRGAALPQLLHAERRLREDIEHLQSLRPGDLESNRKEHETASVSDSEIQGKMQEHEDIQAQIRASSPRLEKILDIQAVSLAELQSELPEGTLLIYYALAESRSVAFVIDRDGFRLQHLPPKAVIERLARSAYAGLKNSRERRVQEQAWLSMSELSKVIMVPLLDREPISPKRIVVVPDGSLNYIPFGALPQFKNALGEYWGSSLLDSVEVVQVPSVSVLLYLRNLQKQRIAANPQVLVFADPIFSPDDSRILNHVQSLSAEPERIELFRRLPHTTREAEAISRWLPEGQRIVHTGAEANLESLNNGAASKADVLVFATHAVIDEKQPELSGVVLSLYDEYGVPQDGFLRLYDLYDLRLDADLVVLSACNTALGPNSVGEGLNGLTRGFFYAGATRLVVSLWEVSDEATADLMIHFYRNLFEKGERPAKALQRAQQALKLDSRWTAPYFWSGFVLQGSW